jgi:dipeptide/tripeptide permease
MGESEVISGESGVPLNQPLTWMCPEGHVFKYRRRPLLSSCLFIFCFFIMERAALYILKTFLYVHVERTLGLNPYTPSFGYLMITIFYGVYDLSPILMAFLSDTYLGSFKTIVIFGFVFVFGLSLLALFGGSWLDTSMGPAWFGIVCLVTLVAMNAGGLVPCLTAFGGSQFHPESQTSSGSKFFSLIFGSTNFGAFVGIMTAILVYSIVTEYRYVLLSSASVALLGWLIFLTGSGLYVKRCVHTQTAMNTISLIWSCIGKRSFDQNRISKGGKYSDSLVDDVVILARLVPVFACLIPLYLGQLQILTTFRTLGYRLKRPQNFFNRSLPTEILLLSEPVTAIILSLVLDSFVYPVLKRHRQIPTHLTRLTIGGLLICLGFLGALGLQVWLVNYGSEMEVYEEVSVFIEIGPLVFFAAGQVMITSSGFELSYSHAPESLRSVSVSTFSFIYSMGSVLSLVLFGVLGPLIDDPSHDRAAGRSVLHPIQSRLDIYFGVCAGLCMLSIIGLVLLRRFYERTRAMRIERDVEKRAFEIAKLRVRAMTEVSTLAPGTPAPNVEDYHRQLQPIQ